MQKRFYTFIFILFVSFISFSNKIDRAFKSLKEMNYFDAKKCFEQELKKHVVPSSFGLATIYFRKDNPFHSIDSAYYYILRSHASLGKVKEKQLEKLIVFGFSASSVLELRQSIAAEFFVRAEKENTALGYQKFMDDHSWANEMELARYRRDSLAYQDAKSIGSSEAFEGFRDNFTGSVFSDLALKDYYIAKYQEVTANHTLDSYVAFLACCPDNPYAPIAQDSVYSLSTRSKTLDEFVYFVENNSISRSAYEGIMIKLFNPYANDEVMEHRNQSVSTYM